MDAKTQIGGDQSGLAQKAAAEEQRADTAVRALGAVKKRIRHFYNEVSCVQFDDADGAPAWAPAWFDYLLDGTVPEVIEREPEVPEQTEAEAAGYDDKAEDTAIENGVVIPADQAG